MKFGSFFENLNPPEKARRIYIAGLKEKFSDLKYLEMAADRSINPDKKFYYNLYQKYWLKELGTINGPDATKRTIELIDEYNTNAERKLASFKINEKNQTVVAGQDDLVSLQLLAIFTGQGYIRKVHVETAIPASVRKIHIPKISPNQKGMTGSNF